MKTTFISHCAYDGQPESKVVHETDAETLPRVLEAFEAFLRGATFVFNGHVDIVDDDDDENLDNDHEAIGSGLRYEIDGLIKLANDRLGTIKAMESEVKEAKEYSTALALKAVTLRDELAKANAALDKVRSVVDNSDSGFTEDPFGLLHDALTEACK